MTKKSISEAIKKKGKISKDNRKYREKSKI